MKENIVACPDCDLLQCIPTLPSGGTARCPRCGHTIASSKPGSLDRTLAFTVAAAIILVIANAMPLMGLSAVGRQTSTTILLGALEMWLRGQEITAVLVTFCTVVAPSIYVGFMLTVLIAVRRPPAPSWVGTLLRVSEFNKSWSMAEVMMLGILVALIKIADLAMVTPGIGMFAVGVLIVLIAAMTVSFDPADVWKRIRWADGDVLQSGAFTESTDKEKTGP